MILVERSSFFVGSKGSVVAESVPKRHSLAHTNHKSCPALHRARRCGVQKRHSLAHTNHESCPALLHRARRRDAQLQQNARTGFTRAVAHQHQPRAELEALAAAAAAAAALTAAPGATGGALRAAPPPPAAPLLFGAPPPLRTQAAARGGAWGSFAFGTTTPRAISLSSFGGGPVADGSGVEDDHALDAAARGMLGRCVAREDATAAAAAGAEDAAAGSDSGGGGGGGDGEAALRFFDVAPGSAEASDDVSHQECLPSERAVTGQRRGARRRRALLGAARPARAGSEGSSDTGGGGDGGSECGDDDGGDD